MSWVLTGLKYTLGGPTQLGSLGSGRLVLEFLVADSCGGRVMASRVSADTQGNGSQDGWWISVWVVITLLGVCAVGAVTFPSHIGARDPL